MAGKRGASKQEKAARAKPAPKVSLEASPARQVVLRKIGELRENPRNVKTHPVGQLKVLDESFGDHGQVKPLVINEQGVLLAGHGSRDALLHLFGADAEVACVIVRQDETMQRKFMLRDNASGELSGWKKDGLGLELVDLRSLGVPDLAALGFKPAALKRLLPEQAQAGHTDPDAIAGEPDAAAPAVSRPGDVWLLGEHRLTCGDCTSPDHVAALLAGELPQLMVTDPPYGVDYDPAWRNNERLERQTLHGESREQVVANDDQADWSAAWRLFAGDVAYVWHAAMRAGMVEASLVACGFETRSQIIWRKQKFVVGRGDYHWQHEPCLYMVRKGRPGGWTGDRSQSTVWDITAEQGWLKKRDGDAAVGHGTQKPIECMARPMRNNSKPGDLVYEPFCGSGTTIIAGEMLGRRVRALELMPAYVDVAVRRWEQFTKKTATLAAGDLSFEAAAAARGVDLQSAAGHPGGCGNAPAADPANEAAGASQAA